MEKNRKQQAIERCAPPGVDGAGELWTIRILWILTALEILFRGPGVFVPEILRLKEAGAEAGRFFFYFTGVWWFAPLLALPTMGIVTVIYLAVKALSHYRYFRHGVRADYTMRRLSDPREYHRRALALPLFGLIGLGIVTLVTFGIDVAIYYLITPGWMNPQLF